MNLLEFNNKKSIKKNIEKNHEYDIITRTELVRISL